MVQIAELQKWFTQKKEQIRKDYFHFLRFRSISADPAYREECEKCAQWLSGYLHAAGLRSEVIATPGLPLVYAEDLQKGKGAPTLLLYGHYDVQPVDPVELWKSPPFEPTERDGSIFARGAVDDKGQIFYAIAAVACLKELGYSFPVNVKFCIEGEEESSSKGLGQALPQLKEKLQADDLLVIDFDQFDKNAPALSLGARGMTAVEVRLVGSHTDLHSGVYGGIAYNPNRALVELLAKLWDEKGRVNVPQFYADVVEPSAEDKALYAFRYDASYYTKTFGIHAFGNEQGKTLQEANCFRPTLEINGIAGGYAGEGIKTVIPAQAHAKITARLVPNQHPEKISKAIAQFLQKHVQKGMKIEVVEHKGEPPFRGDPASRLARAVASSASEVVGKKCRYLLSGGSIPIVANLAKVSGASPVGMGYGLIDDEIHAPNEHFDMHRFEQGFLTVGRMFDFL